MPTLSSIELRVLATLAEKQRTVPDTYPLSLNTLVAGCNQKTSRNPVMELTEADVSTALDGLKERGFVTEVSGSRVLRFAHQFEKVLGLPSQAAALLIVLMLRGPQTVGELRLNAERLHNFADISSVEAFLDEMASREAGALVRELPKAPGARENRWVQLLGGEPEGRDLLPGAARGTSAADAQDDLRARVEALENEVRELRALIVSLAGENS